MARGVWQAVQIHLAAICLVLSVGATSGKPLRSGWLLPRLLSLLIHRMRGLQSQYACTCAMGCHLYAYCLRGCRAAGALLHAGNMPIH